MKQLQRQLAEVQSEAVLRLKASEEKWRESEQELRKQLEKQRETSDSERIAHYSEVAELRD